MHTLVAYERTSVPIVNISGISSNGSHAQSLIPAAFELSTACDSDEKQSSDNIKNDESKNYDADCF